MIYKNDYGTNIIQFGTGDIEVTDGRVAPDDGYCMFPCCAFIEHSYENEIGATADPGNETGPAKQRSEAHTVLVFTDIRSIDVVIDNLNRTKRRFEKNGTDVLTPQEITDEV